MEEALQGKSNAPQPAAWVVQKSTVKEETPIKREGEKVRESDGPFFCLISFNVRTRSKVKQIRNFSC